MKPSSIAEATSASGEYRASGTDLHERRRLGIASGEIIDITALPGLTDLHWHDDGAAQIGALTRIASLERNEQLKHAYPGLVQAAAGLATPQIRRMATVGGSLLQRTRCWYFRHPDFHCYKRGGSTCYARPGEHQHGIVFDLGLCVFPHPSTLGMALLAYEAQVEVTGRGLLSIGDLYGDGSDPSHDHTLRNGEILTSIRMPIPVAHERAAYFRAIARAAAEWPLVEAIARLVIEDDMIRYARVAVGGVANIPLRLPQVEEALLNQPADDAVFADAAERATDGAIPLPLTGYKLALLRGTVLEVLERAWESVEF